MRVNIIIHEPFEAPGYIEQWVIEKGFPLMYTKIYDHNSLPDLDSFDFLVIMGGPMGAYDDALYPWMTQEKNLILKSIEAKKKVLGVCLGAQLLACVLGARVYPNVYKEIGWTTVRKIKAEQQTIFDSFPEEAIVLEWHGDTFDLPNGAFQVATNDVASQQAFVYNDRVLALQFHPEMTPESLQLLADAERANFKTGLYVQPLEDILAEKRYFETGKKIMYDLLENLTSV